MNKALCNKQYCLKPAFSLSEKSRGHSMKSLGWSLPILIKTRMIGGKQVDINYRKFSNYEPVFENF